MAIIKSAVNGNTVNVLVGHGSHLRFLNRRDSAPGVEDEDRDVLFASETVDGGAATWWKVS